MLLIDYREGSHDLVAPLKKALGASNVEETELPSGDLAFTGRGEGGVPVEIGIEFKKLSELIGSVRTGRLQGYQLPAMQESGYDFKWLLVEGEWIISPQGLLMQWKRDGKRRKLVPMHGQMSVSELHKRINVFYLLRGVISWPTLNREHTLKWIEAMYQTWTDQDLDEHKSHIAIHQPASIALLSPFRQAVNYWPEVGLRVSLAAEQKFGSIQQAAGGTNSEWANLTTVDKNGKSRRFGEKSAAKVVKFLQAKK